MTSRGQPKLTNDVVYLELSREEIACSKTFRLGCPQYGLYDIHRTHLTAQQSLLTSCEKNPASAGSNQSVPGADLAIQERYEFFTENRAVVGVAELISVRHVKARNPLPHFHGALQR